ncbi:hypothetical protein TNCV_1535911 [Trichonephila clavipes]|nr:hypothetical protein TNCV_1535911 [Trichonephila clavipes]
MRVWLWWRIQATCLESYKLSPVLHVQDSLVPRSVLARKWVQDFIEKVQDMRRMPSKTSLVARVPVKSLPAERPSERPAEPLMDFLVNEVDVTSRIPTPSLITRCHKSTQTDPPTFHFKSLGKRSMEQCNKRLKSREVSKSIILLVHNHHPLFTLGNQGFILHHVILQPGRMIAGKEHSSGPVIILPFIWAALDVKVGNHFI